MIEKVTMKEAEGALNKVNELEYVRGLDKDGNPISINKEDLATVLGGLIGSQGFADDVDSTFQFGGYIVGENYSKNIPVGFYQYGTLFVFGGSFLTQIYVPYLQHAPVKEIGVRSRWNNIWSEWYHIKCP